MPPILVGALCQFRRLEFSKRLRICLAFSAIVSLFSLYFVHANIPPQHFDGSSRLGTNQENVPHVADPALSNFWVKLESHLEQAKPECSKIKANRFCSLDGQFNPLPIDISFGACNPIDLIFQPGQHDHPRPDHIKMDEKNFACMQKSHDTMVASARSLAPTLPYQNGTSGIVMMGGGQFNFLVLLSLRMLRRSGSKLPVQVFLANAGEYDDVMCNEHFPALNASCQILTTTLSATPNAAKISQYQYKAFAILFSSFENVFFLDADAFVAFNPDPIFTSTPFTTKGLVTWPDLWAETSSPLFFKMANIPVTPVSRYSSDSGVLLYSKRKHAASLILATYYNYYGPNFYYPLLSQGAHGQGDKETYLHAALALGLDAWHVKTPLWQIGTWNKRKFSRIGMGQHWPHDDYAISAGANKRVRPFVLHINNPFKMVPSKMFGFWTPTRKSGKRVRIMGTKASMKEWFGYDVEAVAWGEMKKLACELGMECSKVTEYYDSVFQHAA
ncbi:nucleotide-diphospho-sugar transferase [Microthyrium microscopicum]|uniref:Nucleotide-diphospho-sugar transferase n=1 Tax=Microthyrium microscopicum TaxID=703497 RepID=A0A6A6TZN2_9PEZI|nr:nucleotide-diphospho-sugar transferase [Microthyrium microscopicum]